MEDPKQGPERRRFKRIKANFIVIYKVNQPLEVRMMIGFHEVHAVMLDLSENGMALLTDYNIPRSTSLAMRFTLINESAISDETRIVQIRANGDVRYNIPGPRSEFRLGMCFTGISESDRVAIAAFVRMIISPDRQA